jgi:uncharacterized SAM-binding protein YcdF (DUF218 family)
MSAAALLALAVVGRESLLQWAGDFLIVNDALGRADAIIVVGGNGPERVAESVRLLRAGFGQWLVISGGPYGDRHNSAVTMRRQAMVYDLPADRVLVDDRAESTVDNARGSARLMQGPGLRTAIVVTSPYHTRRAAVIFSHVFRRQGLGVRVTSVADGSFDAHRWWTRHHDRNLVIREYAKLLAFLVVGQ